MIEIDINPSKLTIFNQFQIRNCNCICWCRQQNRNKSFTPNSSAKLKLSCCIDAFVWLPSWSNMLLQTFIAFLKNELPIKSKPQKAYQYQNLYRAFVYWILFWIWLIHIILTVTLNPLHCTLNLISWQFAMHGEFHLDFIKKDKLHNKLQSNGYFARNLKI